jgi:hypothetical protein
VYAPAKTPLQRLLLSGIFPTEKQQELSEVVEVLDPIGLFHQLKRLQRRSPGRYQPLQIRTLQRGMRKIRAYPARKPFKTDGERK